LPEAAQEIVLADHRPRRLNPRHQHPEGAAAKPYRPALGQDPETAELHHRGRVAEANYAGEIEQLVISRVRQWLLDPSSRLDTELLKRGFLGWPQVEPLRLTHVKGNSEMLACRSFRACS
jgi:hypothetical protein